MVDEIMKALKRIKVGKAVGYNRVSSEIPRGDGGVVASLLYQLFKKCWKSHRVPKDWCKAVIVLLYKDLEKAYDRAKKHDLWRTLSMHGVSSRLIQALQCLYRSSSGCVRINGAYTNWFTSAGITDRDV
ncbi:hypothetical protein EVAR_103716_1 [Eumeta japonica]|uniref:Reverse transcriptase domain-containing protein n=1 Tax=Eumeta variegata TaxID=151549 RepID=A0A4C1ZLQ2_EUMVA|nr:hypothetical protein EVAR_103716_1 [Eumeta japonica]